MRALLLILFPVLASASTLPDPQRAVECANSAQTYQQIAEMRDQGLSEYQTWEYYRESIKDAVNRRAYPAPVAYYYADSIQRAISLVYSPPYYPLSPSAVSATVLQSCLNPD